MKIDSKELITQAEYARWINKSRMRVHQMIREGKLQSVPIDGAVLVIKPKNASNGTKE